MRELSAKLTEGEKNLRFVAYFHLKAVSFGLLSLRAALRLPTSLIRGRHEVVHCCSSNSNLLGKNTVIA